MGKNEDNSHMPSDNATTSKSNRYQTCPYNGLPSTSRWADAVSAVPNPLINPHTTVGFTLNPSTKIATAGSCFAQNLARVLHASGFHYYCVEPTPWWVDEADRASYNYGVFSARYGNIYTPRQLLQLFQRALGLFTPEEPAWLLSHGGFADPFRPRIQPQGFSSIAELEADRAAHLAAVKTMIETLDVFVFTLGLTESWISKIDGAVFPVVPGCGVGLYDAARYDFHNFRVSEIVSDLKAALDLLRSVNPAEKILLTVSPVPLVATMTDRHVLQATVYSKSVLRAAAEEIVLDDPSVTYFAAYEIVTSTMNTPQYFAVDKRSVTNPAIDHVMRCFFEMFAPGSQPRAISEALLMAPPADNSDANLEPVKVVCDEDAIVEAFARSIPSRT